VCPWRFLSPLYSHEPCFHRHQHEHRVPYAQTSDTSQHTCIRFGIFETRAEPPHLHYGFNTSSSTGTTQQIVYATYKLTGLRNYFGLNSTGRFIYYTYNVMCDSFGFRSNDPASCPATTSSLPQDSIVPALSKNCEQDYWKAN
jgi:hypothetical protein